MVILVICNGCNHIASPIAQNVTVHMFQNCYGMARSQISVDCCSRHAMGCLIWFILCVSGTYLHTVHFGLS